MSLPAPVPEPAESESESEQDLDLGLGDPRDERTFYRGKLLRSIRAFTAENGPLAAMFAVVFVNLVGFGIIVPLMPFFAQSLSATPFPATLPWMVTLMFSAYSLGQFFAEPFCGRLSDRIGRKPILIATTALSTVFYILLAVTQNIWLAVVIRFFSGMASGNIATIQGYVADMSKPEQRAHRMSLIGAAFSLGFVVGPFIGSLLTNQHGGRAGFEVPLIAAAVMSGLATLGVILFVRESRKRTATAPETIRMQVTAREALGNPVIVRVILATLCYMAAFAGLESIFGLWAQKLYGWGPKEIGTIFLFIGVTAALMQVFFMRPLVRRYGEFKVLAGGLFLFGLSFALQGINGHALLITPIVMLGTFGQAVIFSSICAIISRSTSPDRQGAMLGLNMSAGAIARIIGPMLAGFLFTAVGPNAPLWLGAAMTIPAGLLALQAGRQRKS